MSQVRSGGNPAADISLEAWEPSNFGWLVYNLPDSEIRAAKVCLELCQKRDHQPYAGNIATGTSRQALVLSSKRSSIPSSIT